MAIRELSDLARGLALAVPFLSGIERVRPCPSGEYPFSLPWVQGLRLDFETRITVLVGENGSGKSTLMRTLAALCGLPTTGGSRNELGSDRGAHHRLGTLIDIVRPRFRERPRDAYYFTAENAGDFAALLEERREDPDFLGDPFAIHGGTSLLHRSHGESFFARMSRGMEGGLYLFDEPEAALSPTSQLKFVRAIWQAVNHRRCQIILATHSPILLSTPGATVIGMEDPQLRALNPRTTSHWAVTARVLSDPDWLKGIVGDQ